MTSDTLGAGTMTSPRSGTTGRLVTLLNAGTFITDVLVGLTGQMPPAKPPDIRFSMAE
jgi:hypothetical protein